MFLGSRLVAGVRGFRDCALSSLGLLLGEGYEAVRLHGEMELGGGGWGMGRPKGVLMGGGAWSVVRTGEMPESAATSGGGSSLDFAPKGGNFMQSGLPPQRAIAGFPFFNGLLESQVSKSAPGPPASLAWATRSNCSSDFLGRLRLRDGEHIGREACQVARALCKNCRECRSG